MNRKIFTFWEPKEKVPGYIKLCMETWKKYLQGYEATLLDYEALKNYLSTDELNQVLCRDMTLPMQSDALRCALMLKYGGIWLDADTIITPTFDISYFCRGDFCTVGSKEQGYINGAYIYNSRPGVSFTKEWHQKLQKNVIEFRRFFHSALLRVFKRKRWRLVRRWDFCINSIIEPMAAVASEPDYVWLERREIRCMPEAIYNENPDRDSRDSYRRFWFTEGETEEKWLELERNKGIIMLHNSWTPKEYLAMSEEEFLNSGCFMAVFLKKLLNK